MGISFLLGLESGIDSHWFIKYEAYYFLNSLRTSTLILTRPP